MTFVSSSFLSSYHLRRGKSGEFITRRFIIDLLSISLIAAIIIFFSLGGRALNIPAEDTTYQQIILDLGKIPSYAFHTAFRMFIAIMLAVVFSIIYATIAAKSKRLEEILIPLLDILQSVPILGYISFTVAAFISLAPTTVLGLEMAGIFAIFTSQAWNLTFSVYQSLKSIPRELEDAGITFKLNSWQRFWRIELPFCVPSMIWNMTVSMSGGWFFVVASESISVGSYTITLPGLGSCIALALDQQNWIYLGVAVLAMCGVIMVYNFIIFNPLIVWSDKFRYEMTKSDTRRSNLIVDIFARSLIVGLINKIYGSFVDFFIDLPFMSRKHREIKPPHYNHSQFSILTTLLNITWYLLLISICIYCVKYVYNFAGNSVSFSDIKLVAGLTIKTFARVISWVLIISVIMVPLGIYIGIRPKLTTLVQPAIQFLASFPANLFFPITVIYITRYRLDPDIWLSPLMVVGSMWYILFNVIAGAALIPTELREVYKLFGIKGWLWWKEVALPAVLPSYVTGAITASGSAWNASIIAESVSWGEQHLFADGIGAYISQMSTAGNFPHIALGIIAMSLMVVVFNKIFWQPLYNYTTRKYSY